MFMRKEIGVYQHGKILKRVKQRARNANKFIPYDQPANLPILG